MTPPPAINEEHARLMRRARIAAPGERQARQRELVHWLAQQMCRACGGRRPSGRCPSARAGGDRPMGTRAGVRGLSYQVKSRAMPGGRFRPFAVACCHACGDEHEIPQPLGHNNPEGVQQRFRDQGWEFDAWSARRVTCPACIAVRDAGRKAKPPAAEEKTMSSLTVTNGAGLGTPRAPAKLALHAGGVVPPNKTVLTVEERARIRDILGGTFDERRGTYDDGWSDARVAKEAGDLPVALVADLRETAYGPVRAVAEIEPIRADMARLQETIDQATAQLATLRGRLEEAERQLGVRR